MAESFTHASYRKLYLPDDDRSLIRLSAAGRFEKGRRTRVAGIREPSPASESLLCRYGLLKRLVCSLGVGVGVGSRKPGLCCALRLVHVEMMAWGSLAGPSFGAPNLSFPLLLLASDLSC